MEVLDLQGGEDALRAQLPETGQSGTLRVLDLSSSCPDAFFMLVRTSSAAPPHRAKKKRGISWLVADSLRLYGPQLKQVASTWRDVPAGVTARLLAALCVLSTSPAIGFPLPLFCGGGGGAQNFAHCQEPFSKEAAWKAGSLGRSLSKKVGCIEEAVKAIHSVREERLGDDLEAAKRKSFKGLSENYLKECAEQGSPRSDKRPRITVPSTLTRRSSCRRPGRLTDPAEPGVEELLSKAQVAGALWKGCRSRTQIGPFQQRADHQ